MCGKTFFQNHASIIHKYSDKNETKYLLTDPWIDRPAFGSWLPSFPPAIGADRLLALAYDKRLMVIVSHGHDDHCDDRFLASLPQETLIVIPKFRSPGLKRRLEKLGLSSITEISNEPTTLEGVKIRSFVNEKHSLDDAILTLETATETIIHNNDNWFAYNEDILREITKIVTDRDDKNRVLFMSQTNSASGFPFAYTNFSIDEKRTLNHNKVKKMIETGIQNCLSVGARKFLSYAGYACVYVKEKPEYLEEAIQPTPNWIVENCETKDVEILNMLPGDYYDHATGNVVEHFMKESLTSPSYQRARNQIYHERGNVESCDTFDNADQKLKNLEGKLDYFLDQLNYFVVERIEKVDLWDHLLNKSFRIRIKDLNIEKVLVFGKGLSHETTEIDKSLTVNSHLMYRILEGEILFENLYTGYEGEWSRKREYNRDIVMAIVMFSYFYKNRACTNRP